MKKYTGDIQPPKEVVYGEEYILPSELKFKHTPSE